MLINNQLSKKITFFTFLLTIMVVFLHTYKFEIYTTPTGKFAFIRAIECFISIGISRTAVPLFFAISGFLFFKGVSSFSKEIYIDKLRKRIKTLLIPYLLVSALAIVIYIYIFNLTGITQQFFNSNPPQHSFVEIMRIWLIKPVAYQLWFIQYLMVLCVVSPLIYLGIKYLRLVYLTPIILIWLIWSPHIFSLCLAFFSIGSYFSLGEKPFPRCDKLTIPLVLIIIWFVLIYFTELNPISSKHIVLNTLINTYTIAGIAGMWLLYDFANEKTIDKVIHLPIVTFSFVIYLFHEPFLMYFTSFLLKITGIDTLTTTITYIVSPILAIILCAIIGYLLKKYIPRFYSLLTGSR